MNELTGFVFDGLEHQFLGVMGLIGATVLLFTTVTSIFVFSRKALKWQARQARDEVMSVLMQPNGGKSLYDISRKINGIREDLHSHRRESMERLSAVEKRCDESDYLLRDVLIPRQWDIQQKVHAANRTDDEIPNVSIHAPYTIYRDNKPESD